MNERIRELVKQAGGEFWQRLENDVVNPEAFVTFDPPQSLEKFAELIVRECVKCCEEIADINKTYKEVDLVDPEFGPKECIETIKKHFGVEL